MNASNMNDKSIIFLHSENRDCQFDNSFRQLPQAIYKNHVQHIETDVLLHRNIRFLAFLTTE